MSKVTVDTHYPPRAHMCDCQVEQTSNGTHRVFHICLRLWHDDTDDKHVCTCGFKWQGDTLK